MPCIPERWPNAGIRCSSNGHQPKVIEDDPHALEPTLVRLVIMAAAFFDEVPDEVLHPDDALKYLEAIAGEIDRIRPRDRSRFALLVHDEANRRPELKQFILTLVPDEASRFEGE